MKRPFIRPEAMPATFSMTKTLGSEAPDEPHVFLEEVVPLVPDLTPAGVGEALAGRGPVEDVELARLEPGHLQDLARP